MTIVIDNPTDFNYKTVPYPHQRDAFIRSCEWKTGAYFLEQRTGKTKLTLDVTAWNYLHGRIDTLVVVAPNGVHAQWAFDEIPTHLPVEIPWVSVVWRSKWSQRTKDQALDSLLRCRALAVLCINTDAVITPSGRKAIIKLLKSRKAIFVLDESSDFRTPSAKRTRAVWKLGEMALMRRALSGTPSPEGPLDFYAQFRFLHKDIIGSKNFLDFKHTYAEWEARNRLTMERVDSDEAFDPRTRRLRPGIFEIQKKDADGRPIFKNLEQLMERIGTRMIRVTQQQAFPHMPPKQYRKLRVELTVEQTELYNEISDLMQASLSGRRMSIALVITRLLRLQQVVCGYLPMPLMPEETVDPDFDMFHDLPKQKYEIVRVPHLRLEAIEEALRDRQDAPTIIWARFKPDIDLLMEHLGPRGARRYDGSVEEEERDAIKDQFSRGQIPILVGNQKAGGRGLTLKPAETVIYYSNYFGLEPRLQSEDRPIHGDLRRPVQYIDLVAFGTMEEYLVNLLQQKRNIFEELMGDKPRSDWFRRAA